MVSPSIFGTRRPNGSPEVPSRSVRVPEDVWQRAKQRAADEGQTMSRVIGMLVWGWVTGQVSLPREHLVFDPVSGVTTSQPE